MKRELKPPKPLYLCDHIKNTECEKTSCKYNPDAVYAACGYTLKKEFAMLDEHGEPIKAPPVYVDSEE